MHGKERIHDVKGVLGKDFEFTIRGWGTFEMLIHIHWKSRANNMNEPIQTTLKHNLNFDGNPQSGPACHEYEIAISTDYLG